MFNLEDQQAPVLPGQTTIFDLPTDGATGRKAQGNIIPLPPGVLFVNLPSTQTDGRICRVCDESYVHKDKCTNTQLPLEGSRSLAINTRKRASDETFN
jgi:hypothetical protein